MPPRVQAADAELAEHGAWITQLREGLASVATDVRHLGSQLVATRGDIATLSGKVDRIHSPQDCPKGAQIDHQGMTLATLVQTVDDHQDYLVRLKTGLAVVQWLVGGGFVAIVTLMVLILRAAEMAAK